MLEYLKNLLSATGTKGAFTSLTVVASLIGLVAMGVNVFFGGGTEIITASDQTMFNDSLLKIATEVGVIGGLLGAIIGRLRARKAIGGGSLS